MKTTQSILLYAAEVWAAAFNIKKYRSSMAAVQRRGALRIASAYRTVSEAAVLIIAGVTPIDLLADEKKRVYDRSAEVGRAESSATERRATVGRWQEWWTADRKGRWTHRLMPTIGLWLEREEGQVNFYLTLLLSGYGYFRQYLHKMNRVRMPACTYCGHGQDDGEHTFFSCDRWAEQQQRIEVVIGRITPDDVVGLMVKRNDWWTATASFVEKVLRGKLADGSLSD